MTESIFIALVRHGPTSWNEDKKIQGRTDIELSTEGRAKVSSWTLPQRVENWARHTSPLTRTRQTAQILDPSANWHQQQSLIETDWGSYEGKRIGDLREQLGSEFLRNEARGLDFRPPGGESPRDVQQRLQPWLAQVLKRQKSVVAVTHKGVIRAAFALATQWDMTGKPPAKLAWSHAHIFTLTQDPEASIQLVVDELNIDLKRSD